MATPEPEIPDVDTVSVVEVAVSTTKVDEVGLVMPPERVNEPALTCTSLLDWVNVIAPESVFAPLTFKMTPLNPPIPAPVIVSWLVILPDSRSCAPLDTVVAPAVVPSAVAFAA